MGKSRHSLLQRALARLFSKRRWRPPREQRQVLEAAMRANTPLQARVSSVVKGGLLVDIGYPVRAFLPASHVTVRRVPDLSAFVGQKITVLVIEVDPDRPAAVVSRRLALEAERDPLSGPSEDEPAQPAAVSTAESRVAVDLTETVDFEEVRRVVKRVIEASNNRGASEVLVRTGPEQKRRLRALVATGGFEAVDWSQSRQVADGLVLVLSRQQPGINSTT